MKINHRLKWLRIARSGKRWAAGKTLGRRIVANREAWCWRMVDAGIAQKLKSNGTPCNFDHNGECLVFDCWLSDCAYKRYLEQDYSFESKEELEEMFNNRFELKPYKPPQIVCPRCNKLQEHTYPMSGKLYCCDCGELLDEIYE